jgi:putative spermidine/putrescine transport system substrate-binding protein
VDRRSLLKLGLGLGGLGLTGCQNDPNAPQILGLKGAMPTQLIKTFRANSDRNGPGANLVYQSRSQIADIFAQLQDWQRQTQGLMPPPKPWLALPNFGPKPLSAKHLPDLASLGDYWLTVAINQGLIEPIAPQKLPHWGALDDRWKQLVRRNAQGQLDPAGAVWGLPYRWGATVIVYRRDLFEQQGLRPPQDWSDLLQPQLQGRISLLDSPRETIGLALKSLGKSYNSTDLASIADLAPTLTQLHQQTKFYSSNAYLQPLLLGHTWLAVGWSADLLPQLRLDKSLEIVVPQSGTALWTDLWVRPQGSQNAVANQWMDFCLTGEISHRLALLSRAGSPLAQRLVMVSGDVQGADRNPLLNLPDPIWQKSEVLQPLDGPSGEQYRSLWAQIRQ